MHYGTAAGDQKRNFLASLNLLLQPQRLGELLVSKGSLTSNELSYALAQQKINRERLGRVLVRQRLVSRQSLYGTLAQQWALRCLAGILTFIISFSGAGIKSARASSLPDVAHEISLVSDNAAFSTGAAYPKLFGSTEQSSQNIVPFWKWTGMYARFESDIHNPKYSAVLKKWQESLRPLAHLPIAEMARKVNDMMNAHPYVHDDRNRWGVSDYWEDPLEFLTKNGDCKDYAIAKYASLRMLGIPENQLRIAIVMDIDKQIAHAVVVLYTSDDALILDNQNKEILSSSMISNYRPIFSINRDGWWLHKAPDYPVLASAR